MTQIDFSPLSDRDILVLVANTCNETTEHLKRINGRLDDHEERIRGLEIGGCEEKPRNRWQVAKDNWQTLSLIAAVVALAIVELAKLI